MILVFVTTPLLYLTETHLCLFYTWKIYVKVALATCMIRRYKNMQCHSFLSSFSLYTVCITTWNYSIFIVFFQSVLGAFWIKKMCSWYVQTCPPTFHPLWKFLIATLNMRSLKIWILIFSCVALSVPGLFPGKITWLLGCFWEFSIFLPVS